MVEVAKSESVPTQGALLWYTYILRCADGTLYTGVTTDLLRRVAEHNGSDERKAARYTRARRPVTLVYAEQCENRQKACRREWQIKQLDRQHKQQLICLGSKVGLKDSIKK